MARNKQQTDIKKLADDVYIVSGTALVQFSSDARSKRDTKHGTILVGDESVGEGIAFWGYTNNLPEEREVLISNNNIVPQLIATKRNIILGSGRLMAYREIYENQKVIKDPLKMPDEIDEFLDQNDIEDEYLPLQCKNLIIHGNKFVEGLRGQGKRDTEIRRIAARDSKYVRAGLQDKQGVIRNYYIGSTWRKQSRNREMHIKISKIPAYDPKKNQSRFMMHYADKLLGGPYYYIPHWEGAWTWIKTANCIPEFHYSNIENGYNIRYVIRIPDDYFLRMLSDEQRQSTKAGEFELKKRRQFMDKLNKFFKGAQNSGKALVTKKYMYKQLQAQFEGIDIEPLEVNLQDEAMLKLFETTNSANTSSHGTPPALAGIATGAKMTSGSEIRNLFHYYQLVAAPVPRKLLLKPINIAIRSFYKDKSIKLGFEDIVLTTTDENKSGMQAKPISE